MTKATEDTTTSTDKKTSIVTRPMTRAKLANLGSNLKPSKKSKAVITRDDPDLSNDGPCEEVSNPNVGQTVDNAENLPSGKIKKGVELKSPMITSARKNGKLPVDSEGQKTSPEAAGDSTPETTPNIDEKKHVTVTCPIPVIMGLQCLSLTVSKSPQNVVEPGEPQSGALLSPEATGNQERKEKDGDTVTKRKRGRPFKTQSKTDKTSLSVNHQNGDTSLKNDQPNITSSPQGAQ